MRPGKYRKAIRIRSGVLTVKRHGDAYEMEQAFVVRPVKALLGLDLVCVFASEAQVRNMTPDQKLLAAPEGPSSERHRAGKRDGYLRCRMQENGRITISGKAALVAISEILAEPE